MMLGVTKTTHGDSALLLSIVPEEETQLRPFGVCVNHLTIDILKVERSRCFRETCFIMVLLSKRFTATRWIVLIALKQLFIGLKNCIIAQVFSNLKITKTSPYSVRISYTGHLKVIFLKFKK